MAHNISPPVIATRTFSQSDFDRFGALSGDVNPIHISPEFSARTRFGRTVSHGMLLYTAIHGLLSMQFPDFSAVTQELMFPNPTFAGEEITFSIQEIIGNGGNLSVETILTKTGGTCVCESRTELVSKQISRQISQKSAIMRNIEFSSDGTSNSNESNETYKHLAAGQTASVRRTFTPDDITEFLQLAALSAESGAMHVAPPLFAGMISALLGMTLPGKGTNYLKQRYTFFAEALPGEELTASVEIVRIRAEKALVNLQTLCHVGGRIIAEGEALVLAKDVESHTLSH